MPDLKEKFERIKPEYKAEVYEGKEGLKTIMELILKEKKEWFAIGSTGKGPLVLPYFMESWTKKREKLKISYKVLVANTEEGKKRFEEHKKMKYVEHKFLPKEMQNPQTIWIFGDYVAIVLVSLEYPISFLIKNKEIADSYRGYFDLLWKKV